MELFEAMRARSSVREYRDEPIPPGKIAALQQAALLAPTSLNLQEQKFYFITDRSVLNRITEGMIEVSRQREEWDYLERLAQRERNRYGQDCFSPLHPHFQLTQKFLE